MGNKINEVSPDIRDFLLNRNLILSDTVSNNGLSELAVGLGTQANLNSLNDSIQASEDLEISGIDFRSEVVSRNRYTSTEDMVSATLFDNSYSYNQIDGGYLNENNELNLNNPTNSALDIITSITSQEGFGLSSSGFYPQNNINSSITGRVLGGVGVINDTPLGIIGGEQLLLALGQKASFNAQKELLGKVNLQPFSLLRGADFINPDYSITVRSSTGGKIFDKVLDLSGFELPTSPIGGDGSIFSDDSLFVTDSTDRNNSLIGNTGKGQVLRLIELLDKNEYSPAYESRGHAVSHPDEYGKYNTVNLYGKIDNPEKDKLTGLFSDEFLQGFNDIGDIQFDGTTSIWEPTVVMGEQKSLLFKTKKLFYNTDLYTKLFDTQGVPETGYSQTQTSSGGRYSRGSGVRSEDSVLGKGGSNVFCRTWNTKKQYSEVKSLQKNTGLKADISRIRNNIDASVLGDNGFVKVSPYNLASTNRKDVDAKRFMLSLENLAWDDSKVNLPDFEIGPGDPITGTKGRIMWFPPYDIKFQESTSINWDKTEFIGRGEPIYTYNNSERSGELTFKMIIDHPDYLNDKNLENDDFMASIASGCLDYQNYLSAAEQNKVDNEINDAKVNHGVVPTNSVETPEPLNIYFANDTSEMIVDYEGSGSTSPSLTYSEGGFFSDSTKTHLNRENYHINKKWNDGAYIDELRKTLKENNNISIKVEGYSSKYGINIGNNSSSDINKKLSNARIKTVKEWLKSNISDNLKFEGNDNTNSKGDSISLGSGDVDGIDVKKDRRVLITFNYVASKDNSLVKDIEVKNESPIFKKGFSSEINKRFHKESEYFEKLENSEFKSDKIIYDTLKEKIKFFQPSFHSTTPEGFNSRLTFLQQCTRQGPTNKDKRANNLAFGMPPVCILRIGDFYNTKIIIDSLALNYEPLVWDLNPEGVGVQPMIVNVSLSFKFIGGSSLNGPINELQNAVSFNYFANSEVYDPRSSRFEPRKDGKGGLEQVKGVKNLREFLDDEYENADKTIKEEKNQLAMSEREKNKTSQNSSQPSPSSYSDKDIMNNLVLISNEEYNIGDNQIVVSFKYNETESTGYSIKSPHKTNLLLKSNKNINEIAVIHYLTIERIDDDSFKVSYGENISEVIVDTLNRTFQLAIPFYIPQDINKVDNIKEEGGGILILESSIGTKSSINFN